MASDEETLRQIAELREEISAKRTERESLRRRRRNLERRAAEMGRDTPSHITTELDEALNKQDDLDRYIAELGRQIARLELAPTPGYILPPGEALPQLAPAVIDTRMQAIEREQTRQGQAIDRIEQRLDDDERWKRGQDGERQTGQLERKAREQAQLIILVVIVVCVVFLVLR